MIKQLFRSPFFWLLIFLLLAEQYAAGLNPYLDVPYAADVPRNPLPLRGWPEFIRENPATKNNQNIAIISNSQGVGKEVGDPEKLYTALLEQEFKRSGQNINIENWSVSGLRSDQIELLSMAAARRQLDLLIIVAEIKSLDVAGSTRLGANSDDVDLLAGNVSLWPAIQNSQLLAKTKWDELLHRFLLINTSLVRLRTYLFDRLAQDIPPATQTLVFGHRRSRHALESINLTEKYDVGIDPRKQQQMKSRQSPRNYISVTANTWQKQFMRNRLPTFQQLFPGIQQRLNASGTRLVWLWMPVSPGENTLALREAASPVYSIMCDQVRESESTCIDLTESLPADAFINLSTSSHLNIDGHKMMAALLRPVIENALH